MNPKLWVFDFHIHIAKGSKLCIYKILNWARPSWRQSSQIDLICYLYVWGRRVVEKDTRAGDSVLSGRQIFLLPKCPKAIDLCMVEKEYGVTGAWRMCRPY